MERCLLIDGLNLAYRCFFAVPELTNREGRAVNALQGWLRVLWSLEDHLRPQRGIVFFDQGASARRALLESYKAQRPAMPEALQEQLPALRELSEQMGYALQAQEGREADDLIASTLARCAPAACECFIASADKDLAQCVREGVVLLRPSAQSRNPWTQLDIAEVERHWGVRPEQLVDYLALVGDAADNIPGVPGVGPKTARRWLQTFGSLEGIFQNPGKLLPARFAALLPRQRELLERNRQLIRLDAGLPVPGEIPPLAPRAEALIASLDRLGLPVLAARAQERYGRDLRSENRQLPLAFQEYFPILSPEASGHHHRRVRHSPEG